MSRAELTCPSALYHGKRSLADRKQPGSSASPDNPRGGQPAVWGRVLCGLLVAALSAMLLDSSSTSPRPSDTRTAVMTGEWTGKAQGYRIVGSLLLVLVPATLTIALAVQRRGRRRAEAELAVADQHMRMAAGAGGVGLWMRDLTGDRWWSDEQHRSNLGIAANEAPDLQGQLDRVHPEDRAQVAEVVQRALASGGEYVVRHRILLRDGSIRWIASHGSVKLDRRGKPACLRGATTDVTARVGAELDAEVQRNELAHLSRIAMLGQLTGSIAHELNQPLTAILSNAQAALRFTKVAPLDMEGMREILQDIVADDKRAGEIIWRLRALFERGEAKSEPLDAERLVREVVRILRSDFIGRNVTVSLDLARGLPPVHGDPVQLQQVLLNLIVNAAEAMAHSERALRSLLIRSGLNEQREIEISVVDSGPGLAPERIEKIFEPFESSKPVGIGLGLAISRSIVAAHGGHLWCTNNDGRGATFTFTIPLQPTPAVEEDAPRPHATVPCASQEVST